VRSWCGACAKGRERLEHVDQVSTRRTWSKEEEALSPRRESKVEPGSITSLPSDHDAELAVTQAETMDEPPTLGLLRSDDLWFNDGNIVLRAENTVYRVHIGMLAGNSSVFRTMLALPQPAGNDAETYDGCPLVLMPDSAYDMDQFLKALCLQCVLCASEAPTCLCS
jgi:hypothetical protein